jgi:hypothetical protein
VQDAIYVLIAVACFALTAGLVRFAGRLEEGENGDGRP